MEGRPVPADVADMQFTWLSVCLLRSIPTSLTSAVLQFTQSLTNRHEMQHLGGLAHHDPLTEPRITAINRETKLRYTSLGCWRGDCEKNGQRWAHRFPNNSISDRNYYLLFFSRVHLLLFISGSIFAHFRTIIIAKTIHLEFQEGRIMIYHLLRRIADSLSDHIRWKRALRRILLVNYG